MVAKASAASVSNRFPSSPPQPLEGVAGAFLATMPSHYRGYDEVVVEAHARIVSERGRAPVHLDIWRTLMNGGVAICVVADDRPDLLSLIAAALTAHDLDVIAAQIYTRQLPDGSSEAIDLFWLRRPPSASRRSNISDDDIAMVRQFLADLVRGVAPAPGPALESAIAERGHEAPGMTWVRFEDDHEEAAVLIVQTYDRPGLLLAISRALFCLDLQVVRSDVSTTQGRVLDRFHVVDFNRRPINETRRSVIKAEILAVVQNHGR